MRDLLHDECRCHRSPEWRVKNLGIGFGLLALIAAPGCSDGGRGMHPDASGLFTCTSNADCEDHIACTVDNCGVGGVCAHTTVDSMCTAPQRCVVGVGCSATMTCTDVSMCDDAIACTLDTCNVGNVCGHQAINSMCSAPTPVCNPTMGCVAGAVPGCTSAADCNDSVACTLDSCGADTMCHHMTLDSLCMSGETCNATMGCQTVHACTTAADCMNGSFYNFCDGIPVCSPEFGCMFPTPRACDDGNRCTTDACDRTAGTNGSCTTTCDHTQSGCDSDPACATATPTCTGTFGITPRLVANQNGSTTMCAVGMVHYDITQFTFDAPAGAGMLIVSPGPGTASFGTLTDSMAPVCPSFSAGVIVGAGAGGTVEHYTLTGDFTDDDHFTGMFITSYDGAPFGCYVGSRMVTGTRM
jgi:hypothetical protein